MRDRLFTGSSVAEALAAASHLLGLPQRELRYVVLDEGSAGGRGLQATPARVAVLLQEAAPRVATVRDERVSEGPRREQPAGDVKAGIRGVVRALADAAGSEVACEIEEHESVLLVELRGAGCGALYGEDADGEPLRALEHLLLRMYGEALRPLALRLRCEGFRERREAALGARARRLAEQVRATGETCALEPMNAYERRLVHLALEAEAGVCTRSIGEGSARRVQIVAEGQATAEPGEGEQGPGGEGHDAR